MKVRGMKYSPQTGMLYRHYCGPRHAHHNGPLLRTCMPDGYPQTNYKGRKYRHHTLIAKMLEWDMAGKVIDHINGIRHDNRLCNLRAVTQQENTRNKSIHRQGKIPGVNWDKRHNKWRVQLTLGYTKDYDSAVTLLQETEYQLSTHR